MSPERRGMPAPIRRKRRRTCRRGSPVDGACRRMPARPARYRGGGRAAHPRRRAHGGPCASAPACSARFRKRRERRRKSGSWFARVALRGGHIDEAAAVFTSPAVAPVLPPVRRRLAHLGLGVLAIPAVAPSRGSWSIAFGRAQRQGREADRPAERPERAGRRPGCRQRGVPMPGTRSGRQRADGGAVFC